MEQVQIIQAVNNQKAFFSSNATKDINFRIQQLKKLREALIQYQPQILEALWNDLHKSSQEAYLTEMSIVMNELDYHIRNLKKWAKPQRVATPLFMLPSSSQIITEPLGVSLIVAPWNYPFQLLINPLIGSISSGCCTILKPSPESANLSAVIADMIAKTFDSSYITTIEGGREVNTILFNQRFDFIFFTGSPMLGKVVMQAAAQHLTPVILELGGKSPCIVDKGSHIDLAAKRIVWGKFMNAGQTCISPDYLLVHNSIKEELIQKIKTYIQEFYSSEPLNSPFYPRIINEKAMQRLISLLDPSKIIFGGNYNMTEKFIEPTLMTNISQTDPIMQEEIFGPILPILGYDDINEVIKLVNENEKPLALYLFGNESTADYVLSHTTSGGACINDTLMHIGNHNLPFGGVGNSGMGKYHGKSSFYAFSNQRSVVKTPTWIDLPFKYIPYKYFNWIKKIL
ncbi:MAG: aldehyde dehydrogenase [Bacteroidales bacterium]